MLWQSLTTPVGLFGRLAGPATAPAAARLAGAELELPATISALAARSLCLITGRQW